MSLGELFLLLVKGSFLSFGGLGSLPILHEDLTSRGVTEAVFGQALAVGRVSPGPNGLYIVSLGYQISGIAGALAATVAIVLPPLFILAIAASYSRVAHLKRSQSALRMLSLAVAGLLGWTSWQIVSGSASSVLEWVASGLALLLVLRLSWHPLFLLLGAAVIGILAYR